MAADDPNVILESIRKAREGQNYSRDRHSNEAIGDALVVGRGTAEAGSNATTVVDATWSGKGNDYYNTGISIKMLSGNNVGLFRDVTDYVSASGTFTVAAFPNAVATGDIFEIVNATVVPTVDVSAVADQVWDEAQADHVTAGSMGKQILDIEELLDIIQGNTYKGTVTTATDSTHFASTDLAGWGDGAFIGWNVFVFRDAGGAGAAPQQQDNVPISAYTSSTGTFTHTAFGSGTLAVGDEIVLIHPAIAAIGFRTSGASTGAVNTTNALMAYVKQLVTNTYRLGEAADGTDVYPASVANDSLFAKLMAKGDPAAISSYDNTTDSQEAIADNMAEIPSEANVKTFNATALQSIQDECEDALEGEDLDHLLKLDGATQKYPENCATDSILAKMLVKADPAVPSQFDNSTDSLEAIADAVATVDANVDTVVADTPYLHDAAISTPTANSVAWLVNYIYDTVKSGGDGDNAKIHKYGALGKDRVEKTVNFSNTSGTVNLYTVTGDVIVRIVAVINTNCASVGGCNAEVGIGASTSAIIATTDITTMAAREIWHDNSPDSEIEAMSVMKEFIITDGNTITLTLSAQADSGAIDFWCYYIPVTDNGAVAAA